MGASESTSYSGARVLNVQRITAQIISQEIINQCGDANNWARNSYNQNLTRKYLNAAACSFEEVLQAGANLNNTTFVLAIPGNMIIIRSGKAWEFTFNQNDRGEIVAFATCMPWYRKVWNGLKRGCAWMWEKGGPALAVTAGKYALKYIT